MFITGFCKPRLHCSHSLTHSFIHCPAFEHLFSTAHNSRHLGNEDIAHRPQKVWKQINRQVSTDPALSSGHTRAGSVGGQGRVFPKGLPFK